MHPDLYTGQRLVKPPVVLAAGMLRAIQRGIDTAEWTSLGDQAGQRLFYPPDVSGWDDTRWLDTSTTRGRWLMVRRALSGRNVETASAQLAYSDTEAPAAAVTAALAFWGDPPVTSEAIGSLSGFAASCPPAVMTANEQHTSTTATVTGTGSQRASRARDRVAPTPSSRAPPWRPLRPVEPFGEFDGP